MASLRDKINNLFVKVKQPKSKEAQKTLLEELFNDFHANRAQIYKINFFRGIFFGLGSVLGGTIVIAILIWTLSFFVNLPVIGDFFQKTQNTLQESSKQH